VADDRSVSGLASLEAPLALRVRVDGGRILDAAVSGDRSLQAARVLQGRHVRSALTTLPVLFRLCGTAQSVAGLRAVESAFDCPPGPSGRSARALLVEAEALEQALWRILLDWPRCAGGDADPGALKTLRGRLRALPRAVFPDGRWIRLSGAPVDGDSQALLDAVAALAADVDTVVFGGARGREVLTSRPAFESWIRSRCSTTAAALDWVRTSELADFGGAGIRPAVDSDAEYVSGRLANEGGDFGGLREPGARAPQTGALSRCANAPLVRELHAEYGYGLSTQLAARLVEVGSLLDGLREHGLALTPEPTNGEPAITSGSGLGSVDTARGRLFHWAEVRNGRITRYRTFAPTEWNFHPEGPLARGLVGSMAADLPTVRRAVDLFVTAVDPCVGVTLEVAEA
jgi:hypothetical protein